MFSCEFFHATNAESHRDNSRLDHKHINFIHIEYNDKLVDIHHFDKLDFDVATVDNDDASAVDSDDRPAACYSDENSIGNTKYDFGGYLVGC